MLKDDKSFPYLVLTGEALPRIMYTRHPPKGSAKMGAISKPKLQQNKSCNCSDATSDFGIAKNCSHKAALAMHIGLCAGPCIEPAGYLERVDTARKILNGHATELAGRVGR